MKKVLYLKTTIEQILNDNKAIDVSSIDLKDKSSIADYMIVASGTSSRHLQALSEIILENSKKKESLIVTLREKIATNGSSSMVSI